MKGTAKVFRALADPTRRQILQELKRGPLAAGEIAGRFSVSAPTISRHLSLLEAAGLVSYHREANRLIYEAEVESLASALNGFLSAVCPTQMLEKTEEKMRIAITGGTGFVGRHLSQYLTSLGHEPVLLARGRDRRHTPTAPVIQTDLSDNASLAETIRGFDAIAHCAGINRELGSQTYRRIHVEGTRNVIAAARMAGVPRILMLSFLRARPACVSPYHESKFEAEELIRHSGLDYTVLKAGMIYGRGDHMLDHLSHALFTLPVFATVGLREQPIRPVAIDDVTRIIAAAVTEGRLSRQTVFVLGPETLLLSEAVRRVAAILNRRVRIVPAPVIFHRVLAAIFERTMAIPLVARAQVQMLAEGFLEAAPGADALPDDLAPQLRFTSSQIRRGLPDPGPFTRSDLRCCARM